MSTNSTRPTRGSGNSKCTVITCGEQSTSELLAFLSQLEYQVVNCKTLAQTLERSKHQPCVIALMVPAVGQEQVVMLKQWCDSVTPNPVIVIAQALDQVRAMDLVKAAGVFWCCSMPFDPEQLALVVARAAVTRELVLENTHLRTMSHAPSLSVPLVGSSRAMQELRSQLVAIAGLDSTVLLTGESGTGKTTVARAIHQLGTNTEGPFVALNCASIPRELLEAELFGYERGAFTGAVQSRRGSIAHADGGTLFLDEIGDLPLELQPKLLSFLQDRTVRPLGSVHEVPVNVRVIAATNRDLDELRRQRLFRDDLYYRINVLRIQVPPLRERPTDIAALAQSRLDWLAKKMDRDRLSLSAAALESLQSYSWPGNVRELENVLERAAVFSAGSVITPEALRLPSLSAPSLMRSESPASTEIVELNLEEIERATLLRALSRTEGNKPEAARLLGISLKTIYNKIKKLNLNA